jgi:cyclopropane-fatty-acyl-phospholipid synthase
MKDGSAIAPSGASAAAIRHHYDVGVDFFRLWLDPSLTYSAARWRDPVSGTAVAATLAEAQIRKLDFHLAAAGIGPGSRLLDVGCGWGSLLERALSRFGAASACGLTLSRDQFAHVQSLGRTGLTVHLESYEAFASETAFSGIVSVGAFEHFARPGLDRARKVAIYTGFFERMHDMLEAGGRLSLQTIAWGRIGRDETLKLLPQDIFPESDVPFLDEILEAAADHFRILYLEESAQDYIDTLRAWQQRIHCQRAAIEAAVGTEGFTYYDRYMRRAIAGFERRRMLLFRLVFVRTGPGRTDRGHCRAR